VWLDAESIGSVGQSIADRLQDEYQLLQRSEAPRAPDLVVEDAFPIFDGAAFALGLDDRLSDGDDEAVAPFDLLSAPYMRAMPRGVRRALLERARRELERRRETRDQLKSRNARDKYAQAALKIRATQAVIRAAKRTDTTD
jgi:hypothetical protein